jgi:hypothetical protein
MEIKNGMILEGRAAGAPNPPLISPRHNHKAPWHTYGVWGGKLVQLIKGHNRAYE